MIEFIDFFIGRMYNVFYFLFSTTLKRMIEFIDLFSIGSMYYHFIYYFQQH